MQVAVAMSGGVDSSVAVVLLKEQGYKVIGITMRLFEDNEAFVPSHPCCLSQDITDAKLTCHLLNIPHYVLNFVPQFKELVINRTLTEYIQGRTPNPCLWCNREIKFRLLLEKVLALGVDFLATGHYARINYHGEKYHLLKAADKNKDQSYFLYQLTQSELSHLLFPVGEYHKQQIREIAASLGLPTAHKQESRDLCFAPNLNGLFKEKSLPGKIVDLEGRKLGEHSGVAFFTVGQRRGLRLSSPQPLYVVGIDASKNRLIVGPEEAIYSYKLIAQDVSWVNEKPSLPVKVMAKTRYRTSEAEAEVYPYENGVLVVFSTPQRALTPGQAVVFYQGEEVIGGGIIDRVIR